MRVEHKVQTTTYQYAMAVMIASTITAPKIDPITIAAISPPERSSSSDCEPGASAVTLGVAEMSVTLGVAFGVALTLGMAFVVSVILGVAVTLGVAFTIMTVVIVTARVGVLGDMADDGVMITSEMT